MRFPITQRAIDESERPKIEPQLVLEMNGASVIFGGVGWNFFGSAADAMGHYQ